MRFADLFWDPNKHVLVFVSLLLNFCFITGFWKFGLSLSFLSILAAVGVKLYNEAEIIKPSKELSVFVTGSSAGIGKAYVKYFSDKGFHVFAAQRNIKDCKDSDLVTHIQLDVEDEESIQKAVEKVKESKKTLFALVNNAGIACGGVLEFVSMKEVKKTFEVNVFGLISLTQKCVPLLRACAKEHGNAKILNVSSMAGLASFPGLAAYSASKFAVQALTAAWRNELVKFGIRVCTINPGMVSTDFSSSGLNRYSEEYLKNEDIKNLYPAYHQRLETQSKERKKSGITGDDVAEFTFKILKQRVPLEINAVGLEVPMMTTFLNFPKIIQNQAIRKMFAV